MGDAHGDLENEFEVVLKRTRAMTYSTRNPMATYGRSFGRRDPRECHGDGGVDSQRFFHDGGQVGQLVDLDMSAARSGARKKSHTLARLISSDELKFPRMSFNSLVRTIGFLPK